MPTEKYAHAKELLEHADRIGRHWNLYDRALFQTEVYEVRWDESRAIWTARTDRGDTIRCRWLIPAAGPLHRPKLPGVPGITSFKGHVMHSARWDYNYSGGGNLGSLEKLKDKRVGIIGTGATAVQIVPHLGRNAKEVYVFQRTPSSIDVRGNHPTDPDWAATLLNKPGWQRERMDNFNQIVHGMILDEDMVQDRWTDILTRVVARLTPGMDLAAIEAQRQLADFEKMEEIRARCDALVKDPTTAHNLKPWYNQLCKRPCFHDAYLQTFNRPNVHLIHTDGKGIDAISPSGVIANNTEYPLDCLIYATGFEIATEWSHKTGMDIFGRNGASLTDRWRDGARTLHGWTTRDFPNCFWVQVVQAALSPNFLHVTAEQAEHIAYVVTEARKRGLRTLEPTPEAEEDWVQTIVQLAELRRPFLMECTPGYYNNEGTPNPKMAANASYGLGAVKFLELIREWRANGRLEGLDLRPERQASL
jgi:cation diffusion facilitator CzcD-associated flavoprotein CzcO